MSTGTRSESSDSTRPDCAHLDDDAECLEDPVHCGDARHQHDAHASSTVAPAAAAAVGADVAGEPSEEPAQA